MTKVSVKGRALTTAVGILGAAVLGIGVTASPAQAHEMRWDAYGLCGGFDFWTLCGYSKVSSTHRTVYSCDKNADGYGAWVKWKRANGTSGTVKDSTDSGCGKNYAKSRVTEVQYCGVKDHRSYCGAWKDVS